MKHSFLSILILSISMISFAQDEWKLAKDKNEIKVYTRTKEGSRIKEFKAHTFIKASLSDVIKELHNVPNHKNWMQDVSESDPMEKFEGGSYGYYKLNMPWPASDRDMILKMVDKKYENGAGLEITSGSSKKEEVDGIVRIKEIGGGWKFEDQGNGTIKVSYWFFADPAGSLPAWMINMFIVDGPYGSLQGLKEEIE